MTRKSVWVVEDDIFETRFLEVLVQLNFEGAEIRKLETEGAFLQAVADGSVFGASVVVLDWHLPISYDPVASLSQPSKYHAGLRCIRAVYESGREPIPIIVRTMMEERHLPEIRVFGPLVQYVQKKGAEGGQRLVEILSGWLRD